METKIPFTYKEKIYKSGDSYTQMTNKMLPACWLGGNAMKCPRLSRVGVLLFFTLPVSLSLAEEIENAKDKIVSRAQSVLIYNNPGYSLAATDFEFAHPERCQACLEEKKRSKVWESDHYSTASIDSYTDPTGRVHEHKSQIVRTAFHCDRGHWWIEEKKSGSCSCDWTAKKGLPDSLLYAVQPSTATLAMSKN